MAGSDSLFISRVLTVNLAPEFCLKHPVPLNSRKFTIAVVKAIVQVLSLPSTTTKEEIALMIEGKLMEECQEP